MGANALYAKTGQKFHGATFTVKDADGVAVNLAGADIKIQVKKGPNSTAVEEFTLTDGITVTDVPGGVFTMNPRIITAPSGGYQYDVLITIDGMPDSFGLDTFTVGVGITQ